MKKICLLYCCLSLYVTTFAQKQIESTDSIKITGLVDISFTIPYSTLALDSITNIDSFVVSNHLGEFKKEYRNLKGVSLLKLLNKIRITCPNPKVLSEYYFIFKGSDGYSVVFSWNEIFNTDVGKSIFIITEADNKKLSDSPDRILMISAKDYKTGRRHVKGLKTIEVRRIS